MAAKGVAFCPTLAATEAMTKYRGFNKKEAGGFGQAPELSSHRAAFKDALDAKVTIICGSDAGVFAHGTQARELELMVSYGMTPMQALASATSIAAKGLRHCPTAAAFARVCWPISLQWMGMRRPTLTPSATCGFVMKAGVIYRNDAVAR